MAKREKHTQEQDTVEPTTETTEAVEEKAPVDRKSVWTPEKRAEQAERLREYYKTHEAPMKGRKHSPETIERLRKVQTERYAALKAAAEQAEPEVEEVD